MGMSIFDFDSYRLFLRQYIKNLPRKGRGEINRIANHLGVHSSFISQVLTDTKDINLEQAQELTSYLGLSPLETDYFILLVQVSRAGTHKLKSYWKTKLSAVKSQSLEVARRIPQDRILTDQERAVFYSSWLYLAIWLFTSVDEGQDLDCVAKRFDISRARAAEILRFLVDTRLCNLKHDLYTMGPQLIHVEKGSPYLAKHHINWRVKAVQRSEDLEDQELMFTSPISVSRKDFEVLREQLIGFIKSASDRVSKSPAEDIACLNLDLFWIKK